MYYLEPNVINIECYINILRSSSIKITEIDLGCFSYKNVICKDFPKERWFTQLNYLYKNRTR